MKPSCSITRAWCAVFAVLLPLQGCASLADWQKVQSKIPAIEDAFQLIIEAVSPQALPTVQAIQTQINQQLTVIDNFLQQYQKNLSSVPADEVNKVNAAVAAITILLPQILPSVHATDQATADLVAAFLDTVEGVFFPELASLLPQTAQFPTTELLGKNLVRLRFAPAPKVKVKIITVEEMIKRFNARQHKKTLKKPSSLHKLGNGKR